MVTAMLEVSQKQAYIFGSNKLSDNITNSAVIAYVLGKDYFRKVLEGYPYSEKETLVYSGGGHTVLEFQAENDEIAVTNARKCIEKLTESIYRDFDGLNVFAVIVPYKEKPAGENMLDLTKALEKKKSERKAAFHHGSFGIEKMDAARMMPRCLNPESPEKKKIAEIEAAEAKEFAGNYNAVKIFKDLGGSKNDSNFIAVVHIDGNGMGTRVGKIYDKPGNKTWEALKKDLKVFSEDIDVHFKEALKDMGKVVAGTMENNEQFSQTLNLNGKNFPVRRVITAGDDICFVTEGRIGIECAVAFMKALVGKRNSADEESYASCAGVAIVHQKYPFYKAYDLAEKLCANAKKFNAAIHPEDNGQSISSIDWHIEFGEIGDTLEEIRSSYDTLDGRRMELRPYIVNASPEILEKYPAHSYESFLRLMMNLKNREKMYANGKVKELRSVLKEGRDMTKYYLAFNRMENLLYETKDNKDIDLTKAFSGTVVKNEVFVKDYDKKEHSILFDAIELIDTFFKLDEKEEGTV